VMNEANWAANYVSPGAGLRQLYTVNFGAVL